MPSGDMGGGMPDMGGGEGGAPDMGGGAPPPEMSAEGGAEGGAPEPPAAEPPVEEPANASEDPEGIPVGKKLIIEPVKEVSKALSVVPKFDYFFGEKYGTVASKDYENSESVYGKKLSDISFMDILMRQARDDGYDGD